MTTNVNPSDLNYDHYVRDQYDRDIANAIPFHREIHALTDEFIKASVSADSPCQVLELGPGTGITTAFIKSALPLAQLRLIDFSKTMLDGAKERLGDENIVYEEADYADAEFGAEQYDLVTTVIGMHHQDRDGHKDIFNRVHKSLKSGGSFIFGDLVTYRDPSEAAINEARHYHHLVEHAADEKTLREWAHHHKFLNQLVAFEDLQEWLKEAGFTVRQQFLQMNTSLMICTKDI